MKVYVASYIYASDDMQAIDLRPIAVAKTFEGAVEALRKFQLSTSEENAERVFDELKNKGTVWFGVNSVYDKPHYGCDGADIESFELLD